MGTGLSHEERLTLARELTRRIRERYGEAVLGVAIYGSVARGLDGPYSDLELKVVTTVAMPEHTTEYVHRSGAKVEINYEPVEVYLRAAGSVDPRWPISAGQYREQLVLFERDGVFARARAAAARLTDADFRRAQAQLIADDLYELVGKIRATHERGDEDNLRWWAGALLWNAAFWLALANRTYFTNGRTVWSQVRRLPLLPEGFAELLPVLAGFTPRDRATVYAAAEALWSGIERLAEQQGVDWRTDEWLV